MKGKPMGDITRIVTLLDALYFEHGIDTSVARGMPTAQDYETIARGIEWHWTPEAIAREIVERYGWEKKGGSS